MFPQLFYNIFLSLLWPWDHLPCLVPGASNAKLVGSISIWAIHLGVGFDDPRGVPSNSEYSIIPVKNIWSITNININMTNYRSTPKYLEYTHSLALGSHVCFTHTRSRNLWVRTDTFVLRSSSLNCFLTVILDIEELAWYFT